MTPAEPLSSREIRQTVAAIATFLPTDHAAYIRALPQDQFSTVVEAYVAATGTAARVPRSLVDRVNRALNGAVQLPRSA